MTLTHGADADELQRIAAELDNLGRRASAIGDTGAARLVVLADVWRGEDVEQFERRWRVARSSLEACAATLAGLSSGLAEQAQQQEQGSGGDRARAGIVPVAPAAPVPAGPPPAVPPTGPPPSGESSFDEDVRGTEGQPVDRDLWDLAFYAQGTRHPLHGVPVMGYQQPPLPEGYTQPGPAEIAELGLDPLRFGPDSTPQAYLFQTPDGGYVVAFQGSVEGMDWVTNGRQALGADDPQYALAMDLAVQVNEATGGDVTFTGHSLGGGFAAAAAMATGQPAVTFDASGIHDDTAAAAAELRGDGATAASVTAEASEGQMRAYRMETDGLTNVQEGTRLPDAPGTAITLETPPSLGRDISVGVGAAGGGIVGGVVGGVTGLFDGDLFDVGDDVVEGVQDGAEIGVAVGDGVWGHSWSPMDEAMEDRYPD